MKSIRRNTLLAALITGAAVAAPTGGIASTQPCTQISNQATISYNVGGAPQPGLTSVLGPANQFYVGVKVIVNVTNQDGADVTVTPGVTPAVLKFDVKNDGNAVHDYSLVAEATAGAANPYGAGVDSFDGTTVGVYVENGLEAGYQASGPNQDTATSIDDLAADGGQKTVYIVYTPNDLAASNGALAVYNLKATSLWADGSGVAEGDGTPSLAQAGGACDGTKTVAIVFGDIDGPSATEGNRDGVHSDNGAYIVANANIGVTKSYSVVSDPINTSAPYKAIPGAVVRYKIDIANTGGAPALLSTITDALNPNLKIVSTANNATWAVPASSRATRNGALTADADNTDGLAHTDPANAGGSLSATLTTILGVDVVNGYAAGELKPGETVSLEFDATIQ